MRVEAMDHYLDIQLLPDPEFSTPHLMNALFAKLHRILGARGSDDIGVSFPSVGGTVVGLGNCLRLHGSEQALRHLMAQRWLTGMQDHVRCGEVTLVPASAGRLTVRRVQAKSNPERLRRRQMKRKGWTAEQARAEIPDSVAESLKLPFLTVRSSSTGQNFRLFIEQKPTDASRPGRFNAYGFSNEASLPLF